MSADRDGSQLKTERLDLVIGGSELAAQMLAYHTRNRAHLEPWGPPMPESLFTMDWWERSAERVHEEWQAGRAYRWTVLEGGGVVGTVALFGIRRLHWQSCELGFGLDAARQGRGLMTEAVGAALAYAFDDLALHRVSATHRVDNLASRRVLDRLGFVEEGIIREHAIAHGEWRDQVSMGLLATEFGGGLS